MFVAFGDLYIEVIRVLYVEEFRVLYVEGSAALMSFVCCGGGMTACHAGK